MSDARSRIQPRQAEPGASAADDPLAAALARAERAERALDDVSRRQSAVSSLGLLALCGTDLRSLFELAVRAVAEALDVEYAKVLELAPEGDALTLCAGVGWKDGLVGSATVGTGLDSQAGYTLAVDAPVVVEDLRSERRFRGPQLLHDHGVVSGLSVVVRGSPLGRPYGVLGAHTRARRTFTSHDVDFLQAVANVLAAAVHRARADEHLNDMAHELERRVAERTAELERANRELEAFSYSVSHDLRAPLRGIDTYTRALEEDLGDALDGDARDYLARLRAESARLTRLVNDLLNLSRVARVDVAFREVDVTAAARDLVGRLAHDEPDRDVTVAVQEGLVACADPYLVRVVLDNLLSNAWKFTRRTPDARIEVGAAPAPAGMVGFYVRDNGAGFDPTKRDRLFQAFQRLHPSAEFEGTGVGLATVARIVQRHGGEIAADSSGPGTGASFRFTLPEP